MFGDLNLAFGRDIAERTAVAEMVAALPLPDPRGLVFVETRTAFRCGATREAIAAMIP